MFGGGLNWFKQHPSNLETRKTLNSLDKSIKEASMTEESEKPAD